MRGEISELLQKLRWQATITPLEDVAAMCKSAARAIGQGEIDRDLVERWSLAAASAMAGPMAAFDQATPEIWQYAQAKHLGRLIAAANENRFRSEYQAVTYLSDWFTNEKEIHIRHDDGDPDGVRTQHDGPNGEYAVLWVHPWESVRDALMIARMQDQIHGPHGTYGNPGTDERSV